MKRAKDKTLTAVLSFFGGMIGLHRFYLGQRGLGIFMIILTFFTMGLLTALISLIDTITFFTMDQEVFDLKYNNDRGNNETRKHRRKKNFNSNNETPDYERRENRRFGQRERRSQESRYKRKSKTNYRPTRRVSKRDKKEKYKELLTQLKKHKERGIDLFKDYDFEGAISNFKRVLDIDSSNVAAHFNIACAYSQIEKPDKAMFHISEAVKNGFDDFERIKKHEKLAYARIQPEWEEFARNKFILKSTVTEEPKPTESVDISEDEIKESQPQEVDILNQQENKKPLEGEELFSNLKRLKEQRERGLITDSEFEIERRKLMS
ncbi:NINE protein [Membranihabitans maritimus]|uniref:NINE protein n=1 Tax=Membranihabitans maritimus TaxID=2904244 RepID=UPI001F2890D5|nr:NINE protein [Membranihabitans maritimus]